MKDYMKGLELRVEFIMERGYILRCVSAQLCLTLRRQGLRPTWLLCPLDLPGKNNWSGLPFPSPYPALVHLYSIKTTTTTFS